MASFTLTKVLSDKPLNKYLRSNDRLGEEKLYKDMPSY